jgi:hypothetical protein
MPEQIKIKTKRTSQINVGTARKQKCEHELISIYKRKVKMDNINVEGKQKIADIKLVHVLLYDILYVILR